jgi:hypothetical protein
MCPHVSGSVEMQLDLFAALGAHRHHPGRFQMIADSGQYHSNKGFVCDNKDRARLLTMMGYSELPKVDHQSIPTLTRVVLLS